MRAFRFINTTGGTIPAGAAMVPTGKNAAGLTTVAQPTADSSMQVIFNAPVDVPNNGVGVAFGWDGGVVPVAILAADEPYTAADTFGTKNGDWRLRKGNKGFRLPTASVQGIANAVPDPLGAAVLPATDEVGGGYLRNSGLLGITSGMPTNGFITFEQAFGTQILPHLNDTFAVPLDSLTASGAFVVLITPAVQLFVTKPPGAVPAEQRGFFAVEAEVTSVTGATATHGTPWLLGTAPWGDADRACLLAGNTPFPVKLAVAGGVTSVSITVRYYLWYGSEDPYVGGAPTIRYRVCTGAVAVGGTATIPLLTRGTSPSPACPTLVDMDESDALPTTYCLDGVTALTLSTTPREWTGGGYTLTAFGVTNSNWSLNADSVTGWDGTGSKVFGVHTVTAGAC